MKSIKLLGFLLCTLFLSRCNNSEIVTLKIVDKNASENTKNLYANLWNIRNKGIMFGHHDDLAYGRSWRQEHGNSDTKQVVGDYPAVCSMDIAWIEVDSDVNINYVDFNYQRKVIQDAYRRGNVITIMWHCLNPLTYEKGLRYPKGTSWDNSDTTVVKQILQEGGQINIRFKSWMDKVAAYIQTLTDDNGELIPFIFRPFHEHTQAWNWWGSKCATDEEFISLWRMTVEYMRDVHGLHNLLYAISPQMDFVYGNDTRERLLYRWPGDDYVDFIGMDCYHGRNTEAFISNVNVISALSDEKMKPVGVTETGLEGIPIETYWTEYLMKPLSGTNLTMAVLWRNSDNNSSQHFYSPFPGHPSVPNFIEFYNNPESLFEANLPDMYKKVKGIKIE